MMKFDNISNSCFYQDAFTLNFLCQQKGIYMVTTRMTKKRNIKLQKRVKDTAENDGVHNTPPPNLITIKFTFFTKMHIAYQNLHGQSLSGQFRDTRTQTPSTKTLQQIESKNVGTDKRMFWSVTLGTISRHPHPNTSTQILRQIEPKITKHAGMSSYYRNKKRN